MLFGHQLKLDRARPLKRGKRWGLRLDGAQTPSYYKYIPLNLTAFSCIRLVMVRRRSQNSVIAIVQKLHSEWLIVFDPFHRDHIFNRAQTLAISV